MASFTGMAAASRSFVLKPLAAIVSAGFLLSVPAHAVDFGHSRLLSASGQPLRIDVPIRNLGADDLRQLQVVPADSPSWTQAGLTPPVPLSSLQVELLPGADDSSKVVRLQSSQAFQGQVADVLIDVTTAAGRVRHQVSLLAQAHGTPMQPPAISGASRSSTAGGPASGAAGQSGAGNIQIRKGDTLFSVARKNAVPGVTVWQMMAALYNANPQAFINNNMNLVKAGATLAIPDAASLSALSNAQARALFLEHERAYASGKGVAAATANGANPQAGSVSAAAEAQSAAETSQPRDQLKLSAASNGAAGTQGSAVAASEDDRRAVSRNVEESGERIAQLEDNVRNLSQALQAQGTAAQEAVAEGARTVGQTLSEAADAITGDDTAGGANGVADDGAAAGSATTQGASADGASAGGNGAIVAGAAAQAVAKAEAEAQAAGSAADASQAAAGSWFSRHLLGILTGLLALLVLIVAWLLRRANAKADEREAAGSGQITETMIQEKLDSINLDLQDASAPNADRKA